LTLWLALAFLAPVLALGVTRLQFSNAVEKWLPQDSPEARVFAWYGEMFGHDEFALVTWDGSSLDDPRLEFLARRLEAYPEIDACRTPGRLIEQMAAVNIPRDEAIRRLEGVLVGPGGSPAGIAVVLSERGMQDRERAIELIRKTADEDAAIRFHATDESRNDLHLGGAPVANSELDIWSRDSLRRLLPIATLVCVVLTFVSLRSFKVGTLVLVTSYYSVLAAMALVEGTGASLNLLMVIIPSLVLVVGLSGSIHLVNYWRFARRSGEPDAVAKAWSMAWRPCVFACVTTAIGLGSLATSRITPVREFGIYAALGVMLTLALVLFALPAGLQLIKRRRGSDAELADDVAPPWAGTAEKSIGCFVELERLPPGWGRYAAWLNARALAVTACCLLLFAAATVGLARSRTEIRPIRYFPAHSRIVRDYDWIETHLGGLAPVETIIRFTDGEGKLDALARLHLVKSIEEKIKQLPQVAGTLSLASLSPEMAVPQNAIGRSLLNSQLKNGIEGRKDQIRSLFIDADEAAGQQLWRISALTTSLVDSEYSTIVHRIEALVDETIRDFELAPAAHEVTEADLTGLVPLVMHTQAEVLRGLIVSFAVAFVVIGLVIVVLLRSPEAGLVAMVPNLTPVVAVFGVLGWAGIPIDIGTMMTASVALGIAVDGTLHLLTWFGRGVREGLSRHDAVALSLAQAGPAIVKTSLIAGLGLMVLGASPFLPTQRFGLLMAGLLGTSVIGGIVLLPALLASPVGRILERSARRGMPVPTPDHARCDSGQPLPRSTRELHVEEMKTAAALRTGPRGHRGQ
jgi:predicted RND superfamily exporter protein